MLHRWLVSGLAPFFLAAPCVFWHWGIVPIWADATEPFTEQVPPGPRPSSFLPIALPLPMGCQRIGYKGREGASFHHLLRAWFSSFIPGSSISEKQSWTVATAYSSSKLTEVKRCRHSNQVGPELVLQLPPRPTM